MGVSKDSESGEWSQPRLLTGDLRRENVQKVVCGTGHWYVRGVRHSLALAIGSENLPLTNIHTRSLSDHLSFVWSYFPSVALSKFGNAYSWGRNNYGQLGQGTITAEETDTPKRIGELNGPITV